METLLQKRSVDWGDQQNQKMFRRGSITASRTLIVSHRLPITLDKQLNQLVPLDDTPSGTATNNAVLTAVNAFKKTGRNVVWIGYCGLENPVPEAASLETNGYVPVYLSQQTAKSHFSGFCKTVLWPLFHYYNIYDIGNFEKEDWEAYQYVNQVFAEIVAQTYEDGDLIFIQDYHLMLLPSLLRSKIPNAQIGFFLHIPWPSSELYRGLPMRNDILEGLLGSDFIGFQAYSYLRHFLSACTRMLGLPVSDKGVIINGSLVRCDVVPIGICHESLLKVLENPSCQEKIEEFEKTFEGKKVIVSRDRIEYIKGIPHKLKAFARFLEDHPEWKNKVILIQECRSNDEIKDHDYYKDLCEEIEQLVGSINGKFSDVKHTPIHYLHKSLLWEESCALFSIADAALITPLRDGMNLTSHEFIACQQKKNSPLILSEFTGSAHCLSGTLLVNPWHDAKISETINEALSMSKEEKENLFRRNFEYVKKNSGLFWVMSFLKELEASHKEIPTVKASLLNDDELIKDYNSAKKRVFFFDYDGTLTPIVKLPNMATPVATIMSFIKNLADDPKNQVYIISGRDRSWMQMWFKDLPVGLSCEHGSFFLPPRETTWQEIRKELDLSWKEHILQIFEDFTDRTPGSQIEVKEVNLTWHYRNADPTYGEHQKNELLLHLQGLPKLPIDILVGHKCLEVRPQGVNKAYSIRKVLDKSDFDFVFCIGDDKTDEDMFEEIQNMNKYNIPFRYTISVGKRPTSAKYYIPNQKSIESILEKLSHSQ